MTAAVALAALASMILAARTALSGRPMECGLCAVLALAGLLLWGAQS